MATKIVANALLVNGCLSGKRRFELERLGTPNPRHRAETRLLGIFLALPLQMSYPMV
jgi:hypothetical protein